MRFLIYYSFMDSVNNDFNLALWLDISCYVGLIPNYFYPYECHLVRTSEVMNSDSQKIKKWILETGKMLSELLIAVNVISLVVLITYATRQYIFVFAALRYTEFADPSNYQPNYTVTILIPARNEEKVIGRTLEFMSRLDYFFD